MAAPTLVSYTETSVAWGSATDPKSTAAIPALTGDIIVAVGVMEANDTITITGATMTVRQTVAVASRTYVRMATADVAADGNVTVTFDRTTATGLWFGGAVFLFRNHGGYVNSWSTNAVGGAPSLTVSPAANSALVVANGDFQGVDGTSRTWRTNAGAFTEQAYFRDVAHYGVYVGYHPDTTASGTPVGLSAPAGQDYSIAAVEIGAGAGTPAPVLIDYAYKPMRVSK